jgi:hypothetical protein
MSEIKTITQIRNEGFAALLKALGPGDAIRYVNSFDQGTGDYTAEKYTTPDEDFDTVIARIKKKNELH